MLDQRGAARVLSDRRTFWFVAFLALALFVSANLPWQVDDYDQAKQAFTSFQMVNEGRWLYQTTPHDRIATKPPLIGWMSAGFYLATRSWENAWRLPSLLAALTLGALLYRCSERAYGRVAGLIAFAAFAFDLLTPRLATLVRTDMPLALAIFAVGALIWEKLRTERKWGTRDRFVIFLCLTAGMLIKGPVVWAFLLPGIIGFQVWQRKTNASAFPGWWPWIASLVVFLTWVYGGIRLVPNFYEDVVVREFLGRFGGEVHRSQPIFFYLPHLIHKFAPWSFLLIGLTFLQLRRGSGNGRPSTNFRQHPAAADVSHGRSAKISPATGWLICWSVGAIVAMSLLPSKRVDRIFPVIPVLSMLLGAQVAVFASRLQYRTPIYRWCTAALAAGILMSGGYFGWKAGVGYRENRAALADFGAKVRKQSELHKWRYAVVSAPDESLLLYLRKTEFILPRQAAEKWNSGNIDAVVVSTRDEPDLVAQLSPAAATMLRSVHRTDGDSLDYALLGKSAPTD
ncbi:MAG TPA: glycosyltransferase family 39 protein [Chthoniobacterales bacterium]|nr:glycosyltransferase family 39 protein [Chthoniobacterales bacterium]